MGQLFSNWSNWVWSAAILAIAAALGRLLHWIGFLIARRFAKRTLNTTDELLVRHSQRPAGWVLPLLFALAVLPGLPLSLSVFQTLRHIFELGLIAAIAWLLIAQLDVIGAIIERKHQPGPNGPVDLNPNARRLRTQYQVLRRVAVTLIAMIAVASMLMTFPVIWNIGAGLFASAGAAGLIIGMAARPLFANLLAGMQIALSEPMHVEDQILVDGEVGRVEEIGSAYVTVRLWDYRRLVVPLSQFLEKPFQNWSKGSDQKLATVHFFADYTLPVEDVRGELKRILDASPFWDHATWALQVVGATDRAIELRALMSAADSSKSWDLRCQVREQLISYLQRAHPECLPYAREMQIPASRQ